MRRHIPRLASIAAFLVGSVVGIEMTAAAPAKAPLVHLPADQAAHPAAKNEWWYVVGHLRSGDRTFGFEATIFKFHHIRPPGFQSPVSLFRTDIAITDEQAHRFYFAVTPYFPQSAVASTSSLDVAVGPTSLRGADTGNMTLRAALPQGSFNLRLSSQRPPLLVGGNGYIAFGNGHSYYYSLTDLATSGTLKVRGRRYSVTGISWLDHQWGNWSWTSIRGWTWMALQLGNGVQLSVFDFQGTGTEVKQANVVLANGAPQVATDAAIASSGRWVSPRSGGVYPTSWVVSIPSFHARLRVSPTVQNQELVWALDLRGSYWEGSSLVRGTWAGKPVMGQAYTELTGFVK